jgi:hypothetical protein
MPQVRRIATAAHVALAALVVLGVFVQVYLIASYFFGAGADALDAHKTTGFIVHMLEILVFISALIAWLPKLDLGLAFALALLGTAQIAFADAHKWAGGLHGLFALIVLMLAGSLLGRARTRRQLAPAA